MAPVAGERHHLANTKDLDVQAIWAFLGENRTDTPSFGSGANLLTHRGRDDLHVLYVFVECETFRHDLLPEAGPEGQRPEGLVVVRFGPDGGDVGHLRR